MEWNKEKITPQQIYVTRVLEKKVRREDGRVESVPVDRTVPSTGNMEIDRVAQLLASRDNVRTSELRDLYKENMSLWRLYFEEMTGMTFAKFTRIYRLMICEELLRLTGLPMYDIAKRLGHSREQLSRDFTQMYGVSPLEYRRRNLAKGRNTFCKL